MKSLLSVTLVSCFLLSFASAEKRFVYSSAGGAITVYQVDLATGKLEAIQENPGAGLTAISRDQKFLYRIGGGEIESYRIQEDGTLASLGVDRTTERAGYLSLDAHDRFLAGSNYGGGKVAVWEIGKDRIGIGQPVAVMELEKAAHSSLFSPGNGHLLVPATTPNKVFQIRFDDTTGEISANEPAFVSGPTDAGTAQQPRHIVFHPNGTIAYTTQERESPGVAVWKWNESAGQLELLQDIITFPEDWEGVITTADLHLTPDARFLYVSNRDLTDRKAVTGDSSIVGFRVDPDTFLLEKIGHTPCPQVPRSFAIDRAGEFAYAAGQTAAKLAAYRVNPGTGELSLIEVIDTGKGPNWVQCVTIAE